MPSYDEIMAQCSPLLQAGAALHWLKPNSKAPAEDEWSTAPRYSEAELRQSYREGRNIGIRLGEPSRTALGYIQVIDLDVRKPEYEQIARENLLKLLPQADSLPFVRSGSGGASKHLYFLSKNAIKSKKLIKSEGFDLVFDPKVGREVKKSHWEIDLFGTGKQVVLPPSIHPNSGKPYTWGRRFAFDLMDLGIGPVVGPEITESWGISAAVDDDEDDLFATVRQMPVGLDTAEIDRIVAGLPEDWVEDRDCWLQVGAALHHEFEGTQAGFDRWCEWSKASDKFNARDQAVVWRSFKGSSNPVTMRSLISVSAKTELARSHDWMDDLFGAGPLPAVADAEIPPEPIDWRSLLQYTEDGGVKSSLPNLQVILENDPRTTGVCKFNLFTQETTLRGEPGRAVRKSRDSKPIKQLDGFIWDVADPVNGTLWGDIHDQALRAMLESQKGQGGYDLKITDRDLRAAVETVARKDSFHPVREYLTAQQWDGKRRVDSMFIDYLGCPDTPYHRATSRLTLLGAVVRVFEPGHKFDFVPILEGLQGKGKSTFISILGHAWSTELTGDFSDAKGMVELMQGSWIIEIPELQGFSRAEINDIKSFVSRTKDKVRLAFAHRAQIYLRQVIFVGSTNEGEYLRDATGGRRFWPIKCELEGQIDNARFKTEINQIWAEAYAMYLDMRKKQPYGTLPLYLADSRAEQEALAIQDSRRVETAEDTLAGKIAAWLDNPIGTASGFDDLEPDAPPAFRDETCLPEIWEECLGREGAIPHREAIMIGKAMTLLTNWERTSGTIRTGGLAKKYGGKVRIYRRLT